VLVVYWKLIAMSVSMKVHNTNSTLIIFICDTGVEYLAFLSKQGKNGEL
jgi:hypothetical protein